MDNLLYGVKQLCRHNKDGSYSTQADRLQILQSSAKLLIQGGYKNMQITSLKTKHIDYLVNTWQTQQLSIGTIKNRLSHLRWWAQKINKAGLIPKDNIKLGIANRQYISTISKAQSLTQNTSHLDKISDPYVKISLKLQQAFGLRREESIKIQPEYADKGHYIQLKGTWTKGGKPRTIPITTTEQRTILNQAKQLAKQGALIPPHKNHIQQRNTYDGQCKQAGLSNMHGLRHHYAQNRYQTLTGKPAPHAGGTSQKDLTPQQKTQDTIARQIISKELGHERIEVTSVYLGK